MQIWNTRRTLTESMKPKISEMQETKVQKMAQDFKDKNKVQILERVEFRNLIVKRKHLNKLWECKSIKLKKSMTWKLLFWNNKKRFWKKILPNWEITRVRSLRQKEPLLNNIIKNIKIWRKNIKIWLKSSSP